MPKWLEYLALEFRPQRLRTPSQRQRLAVLHQEDERIGDLLANWEFPAIIGMWFILLAIGVVLVLMAL